MTNQTKQNAIKKLHKVRLKVGYPDTWKDYSKLTISGPQEGGTLFENMKNLILFFTARIKKKYCSN